MKLHLVSLAELIVFSELIIIDYFYCKKYHMLPIDMLASTVLLSTTINFLAEPIVLSELIIIICYLCTILVHYFNEQAVIGNVNPIFC